MKQAIRFPFALHVLRNPSAPFFAVFFLVAVFLVPGVPTKLNAEGPRFEHPFLRLPAPMNVLRNSFAPSLTADGKTMIFSALSGSSRYPDLYSSRLVQGKWTKPVPLAALNSPYSDETPFITPDGKLLIFASDRDGSLAMRRDSRGRVRVSYDLYWSSWKNGAWTRPRKLPGAVNTRHHERSPSLDLKTGTLYFASWPFGDMKRARIMKAIYRGGRFGRARLLPNKINSGRMETAPRFCAKKQGLYFSSQRPGGAGGWDIYFSAIRFGDMSNPVNLGKTVNTAANEFYYVKTPRGTYLASNRAGKKKTFHIYRRGAPPPELARGFLVRDANSGKPLPDTTVLFSANMKHAREKAPGASVHKKSDARGRLKLIYSPRLKSVIVAVQRPGYLPFRKKIALKETRIIQPLDLIPIKKDGGFDVRAINFDYDSAVIREESHEYLDSLVEYLKKNPRLRFEIIGHTDLHGSHGYCDRLSLRRARAVRDYLRKQGLKTERFRIRGLGKRKPLVNKKGEPHDRKNRRTEFRPWR